MKCFNRLIAAAAAVGLATIIAPWWSSSAVAQTTRLRVVDLGTLGGPFSQARAINDLGHLVGLSTIDDAALTTHAFLWRDGRIIDLGTLGGQRSEAFDINNRGEVVGSSTTADGGLHAFLWRDGHMSDLGIPDGQANSTAKAISDSGIIVGDSLDPGGFGQRAFQWRDGQFSLLNMPAGDDVSAANDVNDRGEIVGWSAGGGTTTALRWRDGHPTPLGNNETITAINDRGWMTAGPFNSYDSAWLRHNQQITPIDKPAGSSNIAATGLNNRGAVVGYTDLGAFVREHGRISTLPSVAGERTIAYGINKNGQIAGFRVMSPEGVYTHAVIWTRG